MFNGIKKRLLGNNKKHFILNTSWLMGEKLLRITFSLFITIWLARYLGPERFGTLNYAISLVTILSVLSSLGLDKLIVKEMVLHPDREGEVIGASIFLKCIGGIVLVAMSLLFAYILRSDESDFLILVTIISSGYLFKSAEVFRYWFEAKVNGKYSAISGSVVLLIGVMVKAWLILSNYSLIWFAWVIFAEHLFFAVLITMAYFRCGIAGSKIKVKVSTFIYLLKESWPLMLAGALYSIYTRIDQIMLGEMEGDVSVGVYASAVKISEGWYFIPLVIATALFPAMLSAKKESIAKYNERIYSLLLLMVALSFSAGILVTLFADRLVDGLFGEDYKQAASVLVFHVWGGVFVAMSGIVYRYFVSEGLQRYSFYRGAVGLLINIVLNYFLIPLYSTMGAAIATLVSQFFALYVFNILSVNTRPIFFMQTKALFFIGVLDKIIGLYKSLRIPRSS